MAKRIIRTRPGGRTEKNRLAVAEAVLKLIQRGKLNFELQEVAALAGVHRATLFRRWPDRAALLAEALAEHVSHIPIKLSGKWEKDVRSIAFGLRDFLKDPVEMAMNQMCLITENKAFLEQATRYWMPILKKFERPIRDAQISGLISAEIDSELVIWMMISTLQARSIYTLRPSGDEFVERLIAQVIILCRVKGNENKKKN